MNAHRVKACTALAKSLLRGSVRPQSICFCVIKIVNGVVALCVQTDAVDRTATPRSLGDAVRCTQLRLSWVHIDVFDATLDCVRHRCHFPSIVRVTLLGVGRHERRAQHQIINAQLPVSDDCQLLRCDLLVG